MACGKGEAQYRKFRVISIPASFDSADGRMVLGQQEGQIGNSGTNPTDTGTPS